MPSCTASVTTARGPPIHPTATSTARRDVAAAAAEAPWTAARCLRHLRPILSHLAALRREKARAAQRADSANDGVTTGAANAAKRSCPVVTADGPMRKRVRYTYSLKGTRRRRQTCAATTTTTTTTTTALPGTRTQLDNKANENDDNNTATTTTTEVASADRPRRARLERRTERYVAPGEVLVATPVLNRARKQKQPPLPPVSPVSPVSLPSLCSERPRTKRPAPYRGYYDRRVRVGNLGGSSGSSGSSGGSKRAPSSMDDAWLQFHATTPPALWQLYESVFRAVDALLKATAGDQGNNNSMARSLVAMCLRKVPQYMTLCEEEAARDDDDDDDDDDSNDTQQQQRQSLSDASFALYSDLEALGCGGGWKHLRTVVRAHGIDVIKTACMDGLLHDAFVRLLVCRCVELQAYREAETLLAVLVASSIDRRPCAAPAGVDSLFVGGGGPACLQDLVQYAHNTDRTQLLLSTLDRLLQQGQLPVAWLSTRAFDGIWARILDTLSQGPALVHHYDGLVAFLSTAMTRLVLARPADDLPDERGDARSSSSGPCQAAAARTATSSSSSSFHTLVSVLSSIAAVSLLQAEAASESSAFAHEKTMDDSASRCALAVLSECLAQTTKPPPPTHATTRRRRRRGRRSRAAASDDDADRRIAVRRFLLALAHFVVVHRDGEAGEAAAAAAAAAAECVEAAERAERLGEAGRALLYDAAVAFAASVADSCGRGTASSARVYLTRLCARMAAHLGRACFAAGDRDCHHHHQEEEENDAALLRRMQTDGAFLLASRTNDLRDLAFAERLAGAARITTPRKEAEAPATTARATALFVGYRWEEGISEWVISTPASEPRATGRKSTAVAARCEPTCVGGREAERPRPILSVCLPMMKQHRPTMPSTTLLSLVSDDDDDDDDNDNDTENNDDELTVWAAPATRRRPLQRRDANATLRPRKLDNGPQKRPSTGRVSLPFSLDCGGGTASDDELCL